jgi:hypothetical protein
MMIHPSPAHVEAAFRAMRRAADESGYGNWISDDKCTEIATAIASAVLNVNPNPQKETKR